MRAFDPNTFSSQIVVQGPLLPNTSRRRGVDVLYCTWNRRFAPRGCMFRNGCRRRSDWLLSVDVHVEQVGGAVIADIRDVQRP